jgi:hypothetical protein
MSERNGDRSRFGRERKQKALRRAKNLALRKNLAANVPIKTPGIAVATLSK